MNENNQLSFLDLLNVLSIVLQIEGYEENLKQTSNDVLFKELQRQNVEYLDRIIDMLKRIDDKLTK